MFRRGETVFFHFFHIPVFTGGCIASVALAALFVVRLRVWLPLFLFLFVSALPLIDGYCPMQLALERSDVYSPWVWIAAACFATAGVLVYAVVIRYVWRNRTPDGALAFFWVFGTAVFAHDINHFINARVLLPIIPIAAIVTAAQLETVWETRRRWVAMPLAASAVLAFWVTAADYYSSTYHRDAARAIDAIAKREGAPLRFSATWGFQYYMEELGYRRLGVFYDDEINNNRPIIARGDLFALSPSGMHQWDAAGPAQGFEPVERLEYKNFLGVVAHQAGFPAGFYAHRLGMLPYYIGPVPNSVYAVYRWVDEDSLPPEGVEPFRDE
jgi:hypothetical protein